MKDDDTGGIWLAGICAVVAFVLWGMISGLRERIEFVEARVGIVQEADE